MDGKPGHEKQSLSLVRALEVEIDIKVFNIKILNLLHCFLSLKEQLKKIPTPDLIIAAGHKTHMPLILIKLLIIQMIQWYWRLKRRKLIQEKIG